jgi:hypothetical protein
MTTELLHIEEGYRLIAGELINAMIDAIENSGVDTISITPANGISGSVIYAGTNAAITLALGAITPTTIVASGTISGSNLSGTNTGDQTIILTGDVTGAGTGSFATTLASGAVTLGKMANLAANSIIGNNTGIAATPIALTATQTKTLLSLQNVENTALSTWAGSSNITTLGTIATGVWGGTAVAVNKGGTGQTSYTDGQLLIGNSSGNGLTKATLTAGANIIITNGNGSIEIAASAPGTGTVTDVSVVTANGISGSVATSTTTPAITLTLGAINPSSIGATTPCPIQGYRPVNTQTGTSYTLVLSDSGKEITMNNGSASTLTIPPFASVAFVAQTEVDIFQLGAGQVTITAGAGVTIVSYNTLVKLAGQYAGATIKHTATQNTWSLVGNLAA